MTLLFSGPNIQVAFKNVQGNAEAEISNFSDDYVLGYQVMARAVVTPRRNDIMPWFCETHHPRRTD